MTTPRQMDLFPTAGAAPPPRPNDPGSLSNPALIAAIPGAGQFEAPGLAREAARRGLAEAVPALEALCRRFADFGQDHEIAEQTAALGALADIGGKPAAEAAARLGCVLPPDRIVAAARDNNPAIRAAACRCARPHAAVIAAVLDCLTDLHPPVVQAAALALGRLGRREAAGVLTRLLAAEPNPAVIAALAPIAAEDEWVRLARTALTHPDLAPMVLAALDDADTPRAAAIAGGVRRRLGLAD